MDKDHPSLGTIKNASIVGDVAGIVLSNICLVHCLALPVLTVTIPSFLSIHLAGDDFHMWMLLFVVPISGLALMTGCRQHKQSSILSIGVIGLSVLMCVALFGHDLLSESGERFLTVLGSCMIAIAHVLNYRACRSLDCACPPCADSEATATK